MGLRGYDGRDGEPGRDGMPGAKGERGAPVSFPFVNFLFPMISEILIRDCLDLPALERAATSFIEKARKENKAKWA